MSWAGETTVGRKLALPIKQINPSKALSILINAISEE